MYRLHFGKAFTKNVQVISLLHFNLFSDLYNKNEKRTYLALSGGLYISFPIQKNSGFLEKTLISGLRQEI